MAVRFASIHNVSRGVDLATEVRVADRWSSRARGYLGRPEPLDHQGILLTPCKSIHMLGVGFPLDILFLGSDWRVLEIHDHATPGLKAYSHAEATSTLELKAGRAADSGTSVGDVLEIRTSDQSGHHTSPIAVGIKGERR